MAVICNACGLPGHIARECMNVKYLDEDGKPMWCGECDERARLRETADDKMTRCRCHPASHKLIPHHRVCPHCHVTTVAWDESDCGKHHVAGVNPEYVGPPRVPDDVWQAQKRAVPHADQTANPEEGQFTGGLPVPPEYPGGPARAPALRGQAPPS